MICLHDWFNRTCRWILAFLKLCDVIFSSSRLFYINSNKANNRLEEQHPSLRSHAQFQFQTQDRVGEIPITSLLIWITSPQVPPVHSCWVPPATQKIQQIANSSLSSFANFHCVPITSACVTYLPSSIMFWHILFLFCFYFTISF